MKRTIWSAVAVGFLLSCPILAQDDDSDGPGRGVARLSLLNGDVSVKRGDSGDWVAAAVNAPLVVEDRVTTGTNSRAEVQFDWANLLRLASDSEVRLAGLENRRYQVQLARGLATLRVLRDIDAEFELDTPSVSVRPVKKGSYRVEVLQDGQTEVTVRSGEVEIYTPRGVERLKSGRTLLARGTSENPEFQVMDARARDNWDRWNEDRDDRLGRSRSYQYVSRDIYGADELDDHGAWINVPPYGWVWSPNGVAYDWAPYRYGRWAWVDWYGWSWVSYDPWGWAPYHYGRWFHHAGRWCWYPGGIHNRHYWRPALVAFFGFDVGGVSVGFGFGRVGWVPLAPYETYYPWYGHRIYRGYRDYGYHNIRVVNNINITNVYRNARVRHGWSGLDRDEFVRGGRGRSFDGQDIHIQRASLVQGQMPFAPERESQRFSDREARVTGFRGNEPTFRSRRQAPQVERVAFDQQRRGVETAVRRNFGDDAVRGGQPAGGADRAPVVRGQRGMESNPGRVGVERGGVERGSSGESGDNGGWRRVGGADDRNARGVQAGQDNSWRQFGNRGDQGSGAAARTDSESIVRRPGAGSRAGSETGNIERGTVDRGSEANSDGWRRFGGRSGAERAPESQVTRPETTRQEPGGIRRESSDDGGWRRFGGRSSEDANRGESRPEQPRMERNETPRYSRGESERYEGRSERQESIRINPPIVRERNDQRSEPRYESPRQESPRYEAPRVERMPRSESRSESPRYEAPRMERSGGRDSSPRSSGGDSGARSGGSRGGDGGGSSSRGGGGSSRSSGGGGGGGGGRVRR